MSDQSLPVTAEGDVERVARAICINRAGRCGGDCRQKGGVCLALPEVLMDGHCEQVHQARAAIAAVNAYAPGEREELIEALTGLSTAEQSFTDARNLDQLTTASRVFQRDMEHARALLQRIGERSR